MNIDLCESLFICTIFSFSFFKWMPYSHLLNYADVNTLRIIRNTVNLVIKKDTENAMLWFTHNFMQANPTKFQFMIIQKYTCKEIIPDSIEIHGTTIMRQIEDREDMLRSITSHQVAPCS